MDFKQWLESKNSDFKTITITCKDYDNSLEDLLKYIKELGNMGHSFSIIVDPESKSTTKRFSWDGDGSDYIKSVDSGQNTNETMTSTGCIASYARPFMPIQRRKYPKDKKR